MITKLRALEQSDLGLYMYAWGYHYNSIPIPKELIVSIRESSDHLPHSDSLKIRCDQNKWVYPLY